MEKDGIGTEIESPASPVPMLKERAGSLTHTSQADDASHQSAPTVLPGPSGVFREFASATMLRMLFHDQSTTKEKMEPFVNTHYAAVLFADISGFTRLSASLSEEKLRLHINNYFSKIISVIQEHNGDIVKFCGDALMIIWPVDMEASVEVQAVTVQMATGCGLHLLHDSAAWNNSLEFNLSAASPTQRLGLHCGVASGLLHCMCVGEDDRWEFLVSGSVIDQVGTACSEAKNGELYLSHNAFQLVNDRINCVPAPKNCYKVDQSAGVFAHIPRHDGRDQLQRTWSSYPEVGLPVDSPKTSGGNLSLGNFSPGRNRKKSVTSPDVEGDMGNASPSSSILTFGSSPLKSPLREPTPSPATAARPSEMNTRGIVRNSSNDDGDSRRKSAEALANLKMSFSNALAKEPSSHNVLSKGFSSSQLSVTSLVREPAVAAPRYMSLEDLKNHRPAGSAHELSDIEDRDWSKNSESLLGTPDDESPDLLNYPSNISNVPSRLKMSSQRQVAESPLNKKSLLQSPSAHSAHSAPSSGSKNVSVPIFEHIDEELEDEQIFLKVDVDCSLSSDSNGDELSADVPVFEEQENEYVLEAKNYLAGYLKREGSESLYEFEGMSQVLRCFVQEPARKAVERGTTSLMAELRVVVTMFIEVIGLEKDFHKGAFRRPQLVLRFMLACLRHFGGGLRQYIVDDKGCVLICGFGLPGFSHVDNCARAVETAVAMKRLLQASKLDCKIGIAEGRVYCGLVGSSERCEYAMMGKSVNLAARMMGKSKPGQITVGEEVYRRTIDKFVYSTMPKIRAKGYNTPLPVYCPVERVQMHSGISGGDEEGSRKVQEFIGREQEITFFESALVSFANHSSTAKDCDKLESPFCYMIEGDMGMGKTWLVGEICFMASQHLDIENILIATAESPQSYSATQYDTIRQLIIQIFGITSESANFDASATDPHLPPQYPAPDLHPRVFDDDRSPTPPGGGAQLSPISRTASGELAISPPIPIFQNSPAMEAPKKSPTGEHMRRHSGKFSVNSEATVDINSILCSNQHHFSPQGAHRRRRSRPGNETPPESPSGRPATPSRRVLDWVEKNVGMEDVLTARISSNELTPNQEAVGVERRSEGLAARDRAGSELDSFDSSHTTNGEDMSLSESFSERSLDGASSIRPGKVVTKKVLDMLPLLNSLLNIELPMNDEVTQLSKEDRAVMLNVLLIFIVTRTVEKSKTLLVLEHIQWCDHYSMYIILKSLKIAKSDVFFVGTLRSTSGIKHKHDVTTRPSKYIAELVYCCSHHIVYPFTLDEIKSTLESALGPVFNLSNPDIMSNHNLSTILDRSDGSPLLVCCLCFEIANAIREGTFIDIESLPCGRRDDLIDMFDLLGHSDQLILKVASVIGRSFTFQEMCFLLVMLGLSEFIVDLEAALERMMETCFIEEYHMESKTQANIVGNISSDFGDARSVGALSIDTTTRPQHLLRYRFTNNSVHENVYNLMLEEHREVAHTFLGAYLEPYLVQKPALFDRAVFHFIRSGNVSKKIEYLCKAAEVSRIAGNIRDVYFYFGELVKLSTGLNVQDLLVYCLITVSNTPRATEEVKSSVLRRVTVLRGVHDLPVHLCLGRRWISGTDFKTPIYSLLKDISVENVCRWIGEMGIILFKLGSLQASANLIKLSLHGMGLPVSLDPDISNNLVGNVASIMHRKIGTSRKNHDNTAVPADTHDKKGVWGAFSSVFSSKKGSSASTSSKLPDNLATLKLSLSLFEHLSMINLLHGAASTVVQYLKCCGDIKAKICHIISVGSRFERPTVVSFVDEIIEPEETPELEEEARHRYLNNSTLSVVGQSLRGIGHRTLGLKGAESKPQRLRPVESVSENDGEAGSDVFNSPSSGGAGSSSAYSLSSVSYEQSTLGATPETGTSSKKTDTPNTTSSTPTDFKGRCIARNGQNSAIVVEQALTLVDKAMHDASTAKFNTCLLCLRRCSVLLRCLSDEVGGTTQQFVNLYQAWCTFVNGHASKSKIILEVISKVVSVYEQATLYKWAVELRALKLVLGPADTANVSAVYEMMKQLREILKSDTPTACSSAIMALYYATNRDPVQAVTHSRFAILKLLQRDAVTFVGPVFLFIAGYAAAIAMELYTSAMMEGVYPSPTGVNTSRSLSSELNGEADAPAPEPEEWYIEAKAKSYTATRRYELAEECVSLAQQRLRTVYKTSQPCVVTLYRALKIKHLLCNAVTKRVVTNLPYSTLMSTAKTDPFQDFVFGHAFLRLEQVNLSIIYHQEKHFSRERALSRDGDIRELIQLFSSLGCPKFKLRSFGLCRFDVSSAESLGTIRSIHSLSTMYSEASSRMGSSNMYDSPEDLRRISRIVTQYRPVEVDEFVPRETT